MSRHYRRYVIAPITSPQCDAIHEDSPICRTNNLRVARDAAMRASGHQYGCGILDSRTGLLDVGFGWGVPAPELEETT